jgi:hypothetical protein
MIDRAVVIENYKVDIATKSQRKTVANRGMTQAITSRDASNLVVPQRDPSLGAEDAMTERTLVIAAENNRNQETGHAR